MIKFVIISTIISSYIGISIFTGMICKAVGLIDVKHSNILEIIGCSMGWPVILPAFLLFYLQLGIAWLFIKIFDDKKEGV